MAGGHEADKVGFVEGADPVGLADVFDLGSLVVFGVSYVWYKIQ